MKLSQNALAQLPKTVQPLAYCREELKTGIFHLGVGGFHRSHQAVYLDDLFGCRPEAREWAISGIGLMEQDRKMRDVLCQQDCLFTVVERTAEKDQARIVGSIKQIFGPDEVARGIEQIAAPQIRIVTMTITEKGYCYNNTLRSLDLTGPRIAEDLKNPLNPHSAVGLLVAGLERRFQNGRMPITILSCDNLPGNGKVTRQVVLEYATALKKADLIHWIEQSVAFPNSMVDRITPVTEPEHIEWLKKNYGVEDDWPVMCEGFRQWIIEDRFINGRPALEEVGVQFSSSVHAYEKMKIRLLNGGHSALAYLSYLMGYRLVYEACQDVDMQRYLKQLMEKEIEPTLDPVPGVNLREYEAMLLTRFANPKIKDMVQRLAMDGAPKLVNNLIPCAKERLEHGKDVGLLALALAGWIRYLAGEDEQGQPIEIIDPLKPFLTKAAQDRENGWREIISNKELFGDFLTNSRTFQEAIGKAIAAINKYGARKALQIALSE